MAKQFSSGPGAGGNRALRVGEQIRRTLSDMLMRGEIHDPELNKLSITVGEVRVSADLRVATAYVLPLGGAGKEDAVRLLARHAGEIRKHVGAGLGIRHTPELRFLIDETWDRMDETRRLLSQDAVRRDIES
ncbi:MAG TPA: 30S ribosome-binding factor RbfA [Rhodobacteraceae bacterium]|nr:30S ribosome-binding factor RbfA [Paracoccaceae bacterium]